MNSEEKLKSDEKSAEQIAKDSIDAYNEALKRKYAARETNSNPIPTPTPAEDSPTLEN